MRVGSGGSKGRDKIGRGDRSGKVFLLVRSKKLTLFQPTTGLCPLLLIEEPENGIYVGFLKTLLEMTDESQGPQIIFTSHAPYFIDLFDKYLDGIFVLDQGEQHTQPNINEVKARLEHFPLGEQHFREMWG